MGTLHGVGEMGTLHGVGEVGMLHRGGGGGHNTWVWGR